MTVSMRVMSAGDGYKYLLRTVAAGDGERSPSTPLTRYYTEVGTPPGTWLGSGTGGLGGGRIAEGEPVSEAQLQLLVGMGRDPVTGHPLGRAYPAYTLTKDRVAERVAALSADLSGLDRANEVAAIEAEETTRGRRRAVAGYDFTFSIPKSASVLWAVADAGTQSLIADAHHAAVAEVVAFMEREIAATRCGATGPDGAVAQVDVTGLIATGFDHFDSRASDPHLHTHVVVSNKVRTVFDEKWRSLDGRPLHAATVALSELHEAVFADRLTRVLGVEWEQRQMGGNRNPGWAISTVPETLVTEFSTRSRHINQHADALIDEYIATHGHRPSRAVTLRLRAQATLMTRPEKEIRSLADLTAEWRDRAGGVLGEDPVAWSRTAVSSGGRRLMTADQVPLDLIADIGRSVVEVIGEKRSTWRHWNLVAEAARQTMGWRFTTGGDREAIVGLVADAAERASLRLTPPELASSPAVFQRPDGTSVFRPKHSVVFSSSALLEAEDRLLTLARDTSAPALGPWTIQRAASRADRLGRLLRPDQVAALESIAASGRVVDVLVGPAGTGKTTALKALRHAWEAERGQGSVVGLAPSAAAAEVLADDLGIPTENTEKWWHDHQAGSVTVAAGQLVVVDEASLAGTLILDRYATLVGGAGGKLLLVGDWAQLRSVDAGGAFALLVVDRDDPPELVAVDRFTSAWEKTASLDLRHGRPSAIDAYEQHGRIAGGGTDEMTAAAYRAWRRDQLDGKSSILIADTTDTVTELNRRARADLILDGTVQASSEVPLHDGTAASVGDRILTRRNDRRLRAGRDWVRNGGQWKIAQVRSDGSLLVRRPNRRWGGALLLPAAYVAEHVELGYAVTAYRAQGMTTDTGHALIQPTTTRENLYVAMTRGRDANTLYVGIDRCDDVHSAPYPGQDSEATARSVLYGVLQHVSANLSAHETIAAEQDDWGSIARLAAEYETIAAAAQHDRWAALLAASGLSEDQAAKAMASPGFGPLAGELRRAEAHHHHLETLLPRLVAARGFADADDIAAVLGHRLARATAKMPSGRHAGHSPRLVAGLLPEAHGAMSGEMRRALQQRRELIEQRASALLDGAVRGREAWLADLGAMPRDPQSLASWRDQARIVAAYRDRYGIASTSALGRAAETDAQRVDASRAAVAVQRARRMGSVVGGDFSNEGRRSISRPVRTL